MHPINNQPPYKDFLATKTENTRVGYSYILDHVRRHIGKEVHEATENELIGYFLDMRAKGLKVNTQGTTKACLCSFFKHLATRKIRKENPMLVVAEEIDTRNKDKTLRKALTIDQRKQVLDCLNWEGGIHQYQMNLAILFGFKVGLRRFEIAKVEWKDINFDEATITVLGKGAKKATVPLSGVMIEKLKDYRMLVDHAKIDSRWVMFNKNKPDKHICKSSVWHYYKVIGKRAGLGKDVLFATHDGRRIFCTSLHESKKVDDITGSKLSRHESVDMYKRYIRIDEDKKSEALKSAID